MQFTVNILLLYHLLFGILLCVTSVPHGNIGTRNGITLPLSNDGKSDVATLQLGENGWRDVIRRRRDAVNCQPPSNIQQLFQELNTHLDNTIYLRPARANDSQARLPNELNLDDIRNHYIVRNHCPTPSDDSTAPLWKRSLCPWYYNVTELPDGHYPRVIPQAVCSCNTCAIANRMQCEQVKTNIRIMVRTGCQDGFFMYKAEIRPLSVGCTCAHRRMAQAATIVTSTTPSLCDGFPCTV